MNRHPDFMWSHLIGLEKSARYSLMETLKANILFETLTRRELRFLSNIVYERVYQPHEPIFEQDDRGFGMYIIASGRVAIKSNAMNNDILVTTLEKNSFFGELALVDPENIRSASAIAVEKSVLVGFFKPDLMEILERRPAMGVKILFQLSKVLGRRLLETTEKITLLTQSQKVRPLHDEAI